MSCSHWNEEWVAHLYGELQPAEEKRLEQHLEGCASCRETLEQLDGSRRILRESAPYVPAAPRVVMLQPGRMRRPAFAFASGMACAVIVFALGVALGYGSADRSPEPTDAALQTASNVEQGWVPRSELTSALQANREAMEARFARLEEYATTRTAPVEMPPTATAAQLEAELRRLQRRIDASRARDFELLLREITASELRTGSRIVQTQNALRFVALKDDPRFTEQ